ncbi:MAG: hypothetical protein U0X40_04850 [Ferruginibacter sp.]
MRLILLSIAFLGTCLVTNAQKTGTLIRKASAFYTSMLPGTVRMGEDGQPINPGPIINRVIYLECTGNRAPVIDNVLYNNTPFKPRLSRINENMIAVGKISAKSKEYTILAQKGNKLWKMELEEIEGQAKVAADCRNIIVRTKAGGKLSKFYIFQETQLYTPPTY